MELGIRKMHPFVVSSIYYLLCKHYSKLGIFCSIRCENKTIMRQHSFAKNLNVSFRIRIYVQNLEFAFERPSTVVHTFQHHLLPIWHVSIHLILCSVYQRKIQQWKFFILLFSKFQVFHRCNHISKIFSNRGSVFF